MSCWLASDLRHTHACMHARTRRACSTCNTGTVTDLPVWFFTTCFLHSFSFQKSSKFLLLKLKCCFCLFGLCVFSVLTQIILLGGENVSAESDSRFFFSEYTLGKYLPVSHSAFLPCPSFFSFYITGGFLYHFSSFIHSDRHCCLLTFSNTGTDRTLVTATHTVFSLQHGAKNFSDSKSFSQISDWLFESCLCSDRPIHCSQSAI